MAEKSAATSDRAHLIQCEATVETLAGRNIVRLPDEASAALPSRGQVSVTGSVDGLAFATVIEPDGMRGHWLELPSALSNLEAGTTVTLEVEPTKKWPEPNLPNDFAAALADASDLSDVWKDITSMARWEWVRWVNATKNPETRARRVEVGISKLRSGKRRPCCFDLSACTDPDLAKNGKLIDAAE